MWSVIIHMWHHIFDTKNGISQIDWLNHESWMEPSCHKMLHKPIYINQKVTDSTVKLSWCTAQSAEQRLVQKPAVLSHNDWQTYFFVQSLITKSAAGAAMLPPKDGAPKLSTGSQLCSCSLWLITYWNSDLAQDNWKLEDPPGRRERRLLKVVSHPTSRWYSGIESSHLAFILKIYWHLSEGWKILCWFPNLVVNCVTALSSWQPMRCGQNSKYEITKGSKSS